MGAAIGARLMEKRHKLTVWTSTTRRTKILTNEGAARVSTPAELFYENQVVINITTVSYAHLTLPTIYSE